MASKPETLAAIVADPAKRQNVIDDCVRLIDEEVDRKGGLSGLAIKGAFKMVQAVKKGIIRDSVEHLLDGFIDRLEPLYATSKNAPASFGVTLNQNPAAVADALLGFTDDKAKVAQNATLKKAYEKLRPTAKEHVVAAVPGLGRMLDRHVG